MIAIAREDKLPMVLNAEEVKALIKACDLFQGKGKKDRIIPMGTMLARGISKYLDSEKPRLYLFEAYGGNVYSQRGAQWAISQAVKRSGISKEVSLHTLRHMWTANIPQKINPSLYLKIPNHLRIKLFLTLLYSFQSL